MLVTELATRWKLLSGPTGRSVFDLHHLPYIISLSWHVDCHYDGTSLGPFLHEWPSPKGSLESGLFQYKDVFKHRNLYYKIKTTNPIPTPLIFIVEICIPIWFFFHTEMSPWCHFTLGQWYGSLRIFYWSEIRCLSSLETQIFKRVWWQLVYIKTTWPFCYLFWYYCTHLKKHVH